MIAKFLVAASLALSLPASGEEKVRRMLAAGLGRP